MNTASSTPTDVVNTQAPSRSDPARLLYAAFALLLLVLTFLGFQQFYIHGKAYPMHDIAPPIRVLVVAHGVTMTAWILLFVVQSALIVSGQRRLHMSLGMAGAALAVAMVAVGVLVPLASMRTNPDMVLWGLHRKQFMAIPIFAIVTFGGFVGFGLWNRRKAAIHRPMMLLATLAVIAAATDRITGLPDLYAPTALGRLFGPFGVAVVLGALFLAIKGVLTRSFDRWFAGGYAVLTVIFAFIMWFAPRPGWDRIADLLLRL